MSIVALSDFSARHIHNFWNFKGNHANAISVAISSDARKVVGIGFINSRKIPGQKIDTIHVYDGGDGVSIFEAQEIHPSVKSWSCLEVSVDDDVFFLGGAQNPKSIEGDAFIFALTFDENAEVVGKIRFGEEKGLHGVNVIKRHNEGNVLFIGKGSL